MNESSHSSWTELFWRTWKSTRTRTSRKFRAYPTSHRKLILEHSEEILNNTIESASPSWTRSVLSHDHVIQWTKAKVRVYQIPYYAWRRWMTAKMQLQDGKVKWKNSKCPCLTKELLRIDGEPTEFEWNIFPGICIIADSSIDGSRFSPQTILLRCLTIDFRALMSVDGCCSTERSSL